MSADGPTASHRTLLARLAHRRGFRSLAATFVGLETGGAFGRPSPRRPLSSGSGTVITSARPGGWALW